MNIKSFLTTLCCIALGSVTCHADEDIVLKTKVDSLSYFLGAHFANTMGEMTKHLQLTENKDYKKEYIVKGFTDFINEKGKIYNDSLDIDELMARYFRDLTEEKERQKLQKTEESRKNWAKKYKKYKDIPSGKENVPPVKMIVTKKGTGASIEKTDNVLLDYKMQLEENNELIDSSKYSITLPISQTIPGFALAVCQLQEGATATFVVPYELAYGQKGSMPVPAYADLVFTVNIIKVTKTVVVDSEESSEGNEEWDGGDVDGTIDEADEKQMREAEYDGGNDNP